MPERRRIEEFLPELTRLNAANQPNIENRRRRLRAVFV
jgi:hypothetical protein